ncbi:MAG: HD domain-containing protein [Chloroflexota bacterium]
MNRETYYQIIHKYIPPNSFTYPIYMIHCQMVTRKALEIADRLELSGEQKTFIEAAAMLHDIGIVKINSPSLYCTGTLDYICHGTEGRTIIEQEGWPVHALVAERHTGTGLTIDDIRTQHLPIPERDMTAQSLEEEIISYADLFYSKNTARLWQAKPMENVYRNVAKYGAEKTAILEDWIARFGE